MTANAIPGGGGGAWLERGSGGYATRAQHEQTASLKSGLAFGTTIHPYDGTDPDTPESATGTSIFDPVLCEIAYRWFCPPGGMVLDPFAGGSVRAIVASRLGRSYVGIELRQEQLDANREQLSLADERKPEWRLGDARNVAELAADVEADMVFTCPPYWNLEQYSDDPADLSNMSYDDFLAAYRQVIAGACSRLKDNRFAVWVIGNVRDAEGFYVNLPGRTIDAFEANGLRLYNEAILVTAVGSLPIRVARGFETSRKLGSTHQHVLVFCKGNPAIATQAIGVVEFGNFLTEDEASALAAADNANGAGNGDSNLQPGSKLDDGGLGGEVV